MLKIKSGLARLTVAQTIIRVRYIVNMLTGNGNFPNPPYSMEEITTVTDNLSALDQLVTAGDRTKTVHRNVLFANIREMMTLTAAYVNTCAKGDVSMLESSGFEFEKIRTGATLPGVIEKITCTNGAVTGTCYLHWSGSKERTFYKVQVSSNPSQEHLWNDVANPTRNNCSIEGLTTGNWAYFRVCGINRIGQGEWSDVTRVMVS